MIIKWIKWLLWLIFAYLIWQRLSFGYAILYLVICIPIDFFALVFTDKLAIKGFQEGNTLEDRRKAIDCFFEYQRVPGSPSTPLVTFSQLILGPICSLSIPFIFGGIFLGWHF